MKYGFDLDDTLADTASVINKYAIKFDKEYLNGNGDLQDINNSKSYYYFAEGLNWNKEWLKNNGILYDELFINIKEKSKIVNQLKIDIFIDDSYENCIDVKTNTDAKVYMLSTKYNTGILDKQLERINNIDELISK